MSDERLLALPAEFVFEGKTLLVSPRTFAIEAAFRRWLQLEAAKQIQMSREVWSDLEYQQQMAGWRQECAAGVYAYPMPLCVQALCSVDGAKRMTYLVLKAKNPDVTEELVERLFNDDAKWEELRLLRERLDDPNRSAPGKEALPPAPPEPEPR